MSTSDVLGFVEANPQMAVGIVVGALITAIWHMISRIKRLIRTGLVMAICGGGVAGTPFAHAVMQHLQ